MNTVYYKRRLEPEGGRILHGAGQDHETFVKYSAIMENLKPVIYMAYISPLNQGAQRVKELSSLLDSLGPEQFVVPQIGAALDTNKILSGEHDTQIKEYCLALKEMNRPVFLRLGFEFNGHWNRYSPREYRAAWRKFVEILRNYDTQYIATVWCYVLDGDDHNYMVYYPGDDYVDWWAFDPFSAKDITCGLTRRFVLHAAEKNYPVMIGESTPRWVGVLQGELSWRVWFQRYFSLFDTYPNIKAFCYIAWNWSEHVKYDTSPFSWHWWGEGRVWLNDYVFNNWKEELSKSRYIHAGKRKEVLKALNIPQESI